MADFLEERVAVGRTSKLVVYGYYTGYRTQELSDVMPNNTILHNSEFASLVPPL